MSSNITIKNYLKKIVENIYFISFCTIFLFLLFVSLISYYKQINNSKYLEFTIMYPSDFSTSFQNINKFKKFKLENNVNLKFADLSFYQGNQSLNDKIKRLEKKIYTVPNPKKNNQSAIINFDNALSIYKNTFSIKAKLSSKNTEKYKSDILNYINYIYNEECKILLDIKSEILQNDYNYDQEFEFIFLKKNYQDFFIGFKNFRNQPRPDNFPNSGLNEGGFTALDEYKNNEEILKVLADFILILHRSNYRMITNFDEIKSFIKKNENILTQKYGSYNFITTFKNKYLFILEEIKNMNENKYKTKNDYWYILKHQLIEEFKYEYTKYLNNFAKEISESNFNKIFDEKKLFYLQNDFTKSEMLALNLYWKDVVTQSLKRTTKREYDKLKKRNEFLNDLGVLNKLQIQKFYDYYCHNNIISVSTLKDLEKKNTNIIIYLFCFIISLCIVLIFFNIKTYNKN